MKLNMKRVYSDNDVIYYYSECDILINYKLVLLTQLTDK